VWHHSEYIAVFITDAGNIPKSTIGISFPSDPAALIAIAIDDLVIILQVVEGLLIGIVATFAMSYWYLENILFRVLDKNILADELLVDVSQ
jgi:hypothetical protein